MAIKDKLILFPPKQVKKYEGGGGAYILKFIQERY